MFVSPGSIAVSICTTVHRVNRERLLHQASYVVSVYSSTILAKFLPFVLLILDQRSPKTTASDSRVRHEEILRKFLLNPRRLHFPIPPADEGDLHT